MNKLSSAVVSKMSKKGIVVALSALIGLASMPASGVSAAETNVKVTETATVQSNKKESKSITRKVLAGLGAGAALLGAIGYLTGSTNAASTPTSSPTPNPAPNPAPAPVRAAKPLENMNKEELLEKLPELCEKFSLVLFKIMRVSTILPANGKSDVFQRLDECTKSSFRNVSKKLSSINKIIIEDTQKSANDAAEKACMNIVDPYLREQTNVDVFVKTFAGYWKKGKGFYNVFKGKSRDEILDLAKTFEEQTTELNKIFSEYLTALTSATSPAPASTLVSGATPAALTVVSVLKPAPVLALVSAPIRAINPMDNMSKEDLLENLPTLWRSFYLSLYDNNAPVNDAWHTAYDIVKEAAADVVSVHIFDDAYRLCYNQFEAKRASGALEEKFGPIFAKYWEKDAILYKEARNTDLDEILHLAKVLEEKTLILNKMPREHSKQ